MWRNWFSAYCSYAFRFIAYIRVIVARWVSQRSPQDEAGGDDGENEDAANLRTPLASETQRCWLEEHFGTQFEGSRTTTMEIHHRKVIVPSIFLQGTVTEHSRDWLICSFLSRFNGELRIDQLFAHSSGRLRVFEECFGRFRSPFGHESELKEEDSPTTGIWRSRTCFRKNTLCLGEVCFAKVVPLARTHRNSWSLDM